MAEKKNRIKIEEKRAENVAEDKEFEEMLRNSNKKENKKSELEDAGAKVEKPKQLPIQKVETKIPAPQEPKTKIIDYRKKKNDTNNSK